MYRNLSNKINKIGRGFKQGSSAIWNRMSQDKGFRRACTVAGLATLIITAFYPLLGILIFVGSLLYIMPRNCWR